MKEALQRLSEQREELERIQVCATTEYRFDCETGEMEEIFTVQMIEHVKDDRGHWTSSPITLEKDDPIYIAVLKEAESK